MISQVEAIYENGIFRPLEPIDLPEKQKVMVTVDNGEIPSFSSHFEIADDRWQRFCEALDAPPKVIPALRELLTEKSILDGNG